MYKHKAPTDKDIVTTIVPIHFPKINPPNNANGDTNPRKGKIHKIIIFQVRIGVFYKSLKIFINFILCDLDESRN